MKTSPGSLKAWTRIFAEPRAGPGPAAPLRLTALLFTLALVLGACAGGEKTADPAADAAAATEYYAPAADVLAAAQKALAEQGFEVTQVRASGQQTWVLSLQAGPAIDLPEELHRVVVQSLAQDRTRVHLVVKRHFWEGWGAEPAWAETVFAAIFRHLP